MNHGYKNVELSVPSKETSAFCKDFQLLVSSVRVVASAKFLRCPNGAAYCQGGDLSVINDEHHPVSSGSLILYITLLTIEALDGKS